MFIKPFLLLMYITLSLPAMLEAQSYCGSVAPHAYLEKEKMAVPGYFGCTYVNRFEKTLQMNIHICLGPGGGPAVSESAVLDGLVGLNENFEPIGLQFEICQFHYMEDWQFFDYHDIEHEEQMMLMYYEPNTINVYFVNTLMINFNPDPAGYAFFPGGIDSMVLEPLAADPNNVTWTHEMGHFFGLFHTFDTSNGNELVDGSNCETSGDLVCDTEADPNEDAYDGCEYTDQPSTDSNGDWYVPPVDNYMSYFVDCGCRFTPQQFNRMLDQYLNNRSNLW